jgi:hypothetical protein
MATILIRESAHEELLDEFLSICSRSPIPADAYF